jgi:5-methyltetrahydrofolate--homocysteine methyltransferase
VRGDAGQYAGRHTQGIDLHVERFQAAHDDCNAILLKALADRFAKAFAERLHLHVRTTLWDYAARR